MIEPDETTKQHLESMGRGEKYRELKADPDAEYEKSVDFDTSDLVPVMSKPHFVDNVETVEALEGTDADSLYAKMVAANTKRFAEFRATCGDLSNMPMRLQLGEWDKSGFYAPGVLVIRNSHIVFGHTNRIQIKVKIEEMVLVEDKCFIATID